MQTKQKIKELNQSVHQIKNTLGYKKHSFCPLGTKDSQDKTLYEKSLFRCLREATKVTPAECIIQLLSSFVNQ